MNYALIVKDLNTYLEEKGRRIIVSEQIDFALKQGEILGIIGESGSGKTMTALSLTGLIPTHAKSRCSQYLLNNKTIDFTDPKQLKTIRAKGISYIFQEHVSYINPVFSIGEQIRETIIYNCKKDKREAEKESTRLLKAVGLTPAHAYYHRFAHQLSGGMNQRAMIALAIASRPQILIADEPTSALDMTIKLAIIELIKQLIKELKLTVIWITHDISLIKNFADRFAVMYAGRIIEEGEALKVYNQPAHPYTQALINCLPEHQKPDKALCITGEPPDLAALPAGCKFNTRCPFAYKECFQQEPDFINTCPTQKAKCYLLRKI